MPTFKTTCAANMDAGEQARIGGPVPDSPELSLSAATNSSALNVGDAARLSLTTNIFNQPITLKLGGSATAALSICSGDAQLSGSVVTVTATNPPAATTVVLCAAATTVGTVTATISATPASVEQIGRSQSVNPGLVPPCQVYATFHMAQLSTISDSASAVFVAPARSPTPTNSAHESSSLADTGSSLGFWILLPLLAISIGCGLVAAARRRRARS